MNIYICIFLTILYILYNIIQSKLRVGEINYRRNEYKTKITL